MTQIYTPSCFPLHQRQQGFPWLLQSPRKVIKIMKQHNYKAQKYCWFSCHKNSVSTESFNSNDNKPIRDRNLLEQTIVATTSTESELLATSNLWKKVDAFYRFTRPHTIIGSIVGVTSVSLLPLVSVEDLSLSFFLGLMKVMIPIVCVNIYIVGLNQLYDVEIDKVNKPNLPIASGEYSMELGKAIVLAFGLMSIVMGIISRSPPVLYCILICFFFGTAYSVDLPLFRWKTNAFLAAMCIVIVRAITFQLTVFFHIQMYVLGRPVAFSRSLAFAIMCMSLFVTVIALFKDIPDEDGDKDFGIQTTTVTLGKKRVFWLCIAILLIAYGSAVVIGASSSLLLSKLVTVTGHCILASILWIRAHSVDLESNKSITSFYMFIWKLFYAEYLLIPFVR